MKPSVPAQLVIVLALVIAAVSSRTEAHKPVTSKFTYVKDVFPILREKCASCHVAGGIAPMSLMSYEDAFPWAESIRAELVAGHMPPGSADPAFSAIRNNRRLTARETDVILTWATGGNPRGPLDATMPVVSLDQTWRLGPPDLILKLPESFTLQAEKPEDTHEFALSLDTSPSRWIRAIDVHPGTPSVVHDATIFLKLPGSDDAPEARPVIGRWIPGDRAGLPDGGTAFYAPAGAQIVARLHYKRTWQYEGKALTDRSSIGLYFDHAGAPRKLTAVSLDSPTPIAPSQNVSFATEIDRDVEAVAIVASQVPDNARVQVEAIRLDGTRTPLVRFDEQPGWERRFWFEQPISLPQHTRLEVHATFNDPTLIAAAFGGASPRTTQESKILKLLLDVVGHDTSVRRH